MPDDNNAPRDGGLLPRMREALADLRDMGVNMEEREEVDGNLHDLDEAIATCDVADILRSYTVANEHLEKTVLSKSPEGPKADLLHLKHQLVWGSFARLREIMFRETVLGILRCGGSEAPANIGPASPPRLIEPPRPAQESSRPRRPLSAYNLFMKECASKKEGRGKSFTDCVQEWKERPK
jgi:hypothetical protein